MAPAPLQAALPADTPNSAGSTNSPSDARLPGDLAIWFFILAELLVFAVFFLAYAFARARNVPLFNESQLTLDLNAGAGTVTPQNIDSLVELIDAGIR